MSSKPILESIIRVYSDMKDFMLGPQITGSNMLIGQLSKLLLREPKSFFVSGARSVSIASQLLDVQVNDQTGYATVTMRRAPVNGLNLELLQALTKTFDELTSNRSRGMILTSALPTIFSGGLDIMEMYKPEPTRLREFWSTLQDCWLKLYGSAFPTVAAINGHSPAGGCLLAMCCEYRIMVNGDYTIGLNETALGIVAPTWFQDTMRGTIAPRKAELALTLGKMFPVEEALKIELIDEIALDKNDALAKAEVFLNKFKKINPLARSTSKYLFRSKALNDLEEKRDMDLEIFVSTVTNPKVQKSLEGYIQALKSKSK